MTLNEERITETARLLKERDHATAAILRWQAKLDSANASLALMLNNVPVNATEPEAAPVPE
jgi:hypothetical protein